MHALGFHDCILFPIVAFGQFFALATAGCQRCALFADAGWKPGVMERRMAQLQFRFEKAFELVIFIQFVYTSS